MSKQDFLKTQTCILKVNIHCNGCERKVKKLLRKIDGVNSVSIDAEEGKVVVGGDVDPAKLIKKLERSGKHAEIWGGQRGMIYNQNYPINHQFQNLQGKGGKDNKSQNQKGQKGEGGDGGQLAHFQNIKGAQGLDVPAKQHKSVKFNLPEEEFDASDEGLGEFDGHHKFEDNFGQGHPMQNKMMPVMGNGRGPHGPTGMMNEPTMNNHKGYGDGVGNYGSAKKGDVIDLPMQIKGKGGNYPCHDKNGKSEKGSNGNANGNVGLMGPMNQKGPMGINYPMGQMGNIPAMNGGGDNYEGMQMQPTPYNLQQQQYMAMMMDQQQQQQANMNNMYQPAMMYGRPHPSLPPPPMPSHPMAENITHVFSDENTQGYCSIM